MNNEAFLYKYFCSGEDTADNTAAAGSREWGGVHIGYI